MAPAGTCVFAAGVFALAHRVANRLREAFDPELVCLYVSSEELAALRRAAAREEAARRIRGV